MEENKEKKNEGIKKSDDLAKIAISREADSALVEIIERINDGFDGGRATKQDVTSVIVLDFFKELTDSHIHKLRVSFFDPITMMEATLKKAKETGILPESVKELFLKQFADSAHTVRKPKKNLKSDVIIDNIKNEQEVA